jgi:hypothetical protein
MSAAKSPLPRMLYTGTALPSINVIFTGFNNRARSSALMLNLRGRCSALCRPTWYWQNHTYVNYLVIPSRYNVSEQRKRRSQKRDHPTFK